MSPSSGMPTNAHLSTACASSSSGSSPIAQGPSAAAIRRGSLVRTASSISQMATGPVAPGASPRARSTARRSAAFAAAVEGLEVDAGPAAATSSTPRGIVDRPAVHVVRRPAGIERAASDAPTDAREEDLEAGGICLDLRLGLREPVAPGLGELRRERGAHVVDAPKWIHVTDLLAASCLAAGHSAPTARAVRWRPLEASAEACSGIMPRIPDPTTRPRFFALGRSAASRCAGITEAACAAANAVPRRAEAPGDSVRAARPRAGERGGGRHERRRGRGASRHLGRAALHLTGGDARDHQRVQPGDQRGRHRGAAAAVGGADEHVERPGGRHRRGPALAALRAEVVQPDGAGERERGRRPAAREAGEREPAAGEARGDAQRGVGADPAGGDRPAGALERIDVAVGPVVEGHAGHVQQGGGGDERRLPQRRRLSRATNRAADRATASTSPGTVTTAGRRTRSARLRGSGLTSAPRCAAAGRPWRPASPARRSRGRRPVRRGRARA